MASALISPITPPRKQFDNCTHGRMTRLFNTNIEVRCQRCGQVPSLGWVFRCVEHSGGHLPASDFGIEEWNQKPALKNNRFSTSLNPSLMKSNQLGHYTKEQVGMMRDQKRHVGQTIKNQENSERRLAARDKIERETSIRSRFRFTRASPPIDQPTELCTFRICLQCRPLLKERGFLGIEEVLRNDIEAVWPPSHDWDNRRLAAVDTLRGLGLKQVPVCCQERSIITSSSGFSISTEEDNAEDEDLILMKDAATLSSALSRETLVEGATGISAIRFEKALGVPEVIRQVEESRE